MPSFYRYGTMLISNLNCLGLHKVVLTITINLQEKVEDEDAKALFLLEQLCFLESQKGRWREETGKNCVLWHAKSPSGYNLLRESGLLTLPSRSTLKRYIGACTGEVVSSLIKQRLHMETKLHSEEVTSRLLLYQGSYRGAAPASCNESDGVGRRSRIQSCVACRRQPCLQLQVFFPAFQVAQFSLL